MSELRAAIIGCGAIFPMHAASIACTDGVRLVSVCDVDENAARKRADECGCSYYTDYKKMIEDEKPDCVHICLPHFLHAPVSIYALSNGCNVLCEKPMALSISDAEAMLEADKKSKGTLGIIFQNRYNAGSLLIKNTLESGKLGKIIGARATVHWYRSDEYYSESNWRGNISTEGGGVCVNQAIHTLDLMLWFMGDKPISVNAGIATRNHNIEVEDEAGGIIKYSDNKTASFSFNNYNAYDAPVEVEVKCENGTAKLVGDKGYITYKDGSTIQSKDNDEYIEYGDMKSYWGYSHVYQIRDYYKHLIAGSKLHVTPEMAYETTKIMLAILKSGRENKEITID